MGGISSAIRDALVAHPQTVVTIVSSTMMSLLSAALGALAAKAWDVYRKRGALTLLRPTIRMTIVTPRQMGEMSPRLLQDGARVMKFDFSTLIVSTFPEMKAFVVERVDFMNGNGRSARPITDDLGATQIEKISLNEVDSCDGYAYPDGFVRAYIHGRCVQTGEGASKRLDDWTHLRMSLLTSPNKVVHLWFSRAGAPCENVTDALAE